MIKYFLICENGFIGTGYYETHEAAEEAARFREYCTHRHWYVRMLKDYITVL